MMEPQAPQIGVIALVSNRWNDLWQPRHHVVSRLARYFHVVWLNPAPNWREVLRSPLEYANVERNPLPGLRVHSPDFRLPRLYRPRRLSETLSRIRLRGAEKTLRRLGCDRVVVYAWRPEFVGTLDVLDHDVSAYHIDDEYQFNDAGAPIPAEEAELLKRVDQVFIHSPGLLEKKGKLNPRTLFLPNGVDFDLYARTIPEPPDLSGIPSPRIGYTGWIKKQLDWELITAIAEKHPEWSFVFVGEHHQHAEIQEPVERLARRANVYFLGAKSVTELAAYPQHFDVCIMPYKVDAYTNFIYPLKLHEYLASGTPVVGTPIRSLQAFSDSVALANSLEGWSAALFHALKRESRTSENRASRQAVARMYDWEVLVGRIAESFANLLGEDIRQRIEVPAPPPVGTATG